MIKLTTLAIRDRYLRYAVASMKSLHRFFGDTVDYVVFFGWANTPDYDVPEWIKLVNIEDFAAERDTIHYETGKPVENAEEYYLGTRYAARDMKSIPLVHPVCDGSDVVFFDADTIAFDSGVVNLVAEVNQSDFYCVRGKKKDEDRFLKRGGRFYSFQDYKNAVARHDYTITQNIYTHAGLMGRKSNDIGLKISKHFERLLCEKPLLWPRERSYFGDEHYLNIAFQCTEGVAQAHLPTEAPANNLFYATTKSPVSHGGIDESPVFKHHDGSLIKPSMVHFVEQKQEFYLSCLNAYGVLNGTDPE